MSAFDPRSPFSMPPVVKNIIIINVIVFVAMELTQNVYHNYFMMEHLALYDIRSPYFEPHQLITHMFMHANLAHIFFNMFGVFMFGRVLESVWGSKRMLVFYTVSGLGAALVQLTVTYFQMNKMLSLADGFNANPNYAVFQEFFNRYGIKGLSDYTEIKKMVNDWFYNTDSKQYVAQARQYIIEIAGYRLNTPTIGASGAVFGLLIAFAVLFPEVELMLIFLPIPIKAKYFIPGYAIIELFFGVAGFKWDNIAHFAHLGGALFGFILVMYWRRNRFKRY